MVDLNQVLDNIYIIFGLLSIPIALVALLSRRE